MDVLASNKSKTTTKHPQRHQQQSGFSLLEILVAFVIMGLVIGSILQLFGNSMRSVALSDEYSYAVKIAESQMATVGVSIPVESGNTSGSEDKFDWNIMIEPTEFEYPEGAAPIPLYPYRVKVDVAWQSGSRERHFELASLRFGKEP